MKYVMFISFLLLNLSFAKSYDKGISIIVLPHDISAVGNRKSYIGSTYKKIIEKYPHTTVYSLEPHNASELKKGLKALAENKLIDAIVFITHGSSKVDDNTHSMTLYNESGTFKLYLLTLLEKWIEPIKNKMSFNCTISFIGCSLLRSAHNTGELKVIAQNMKKVFDSFGPKIGCQLYMNYTEGSSIKDITFKQAILEQPGATHIFTNTISKILTPLSFPLYYSLDRYVYNNGYLLEKEYHYDSLYRSTFDESLEKALHGMDYAIHTAGDTSYDLRDLKRLEKVNVEGVKNFYEACVRQGVKRIVHTSSVAALGFDPKGSAVDETVHYNWPKDLPYMQTKKQGQDIALEYAKKGIKVVILNPATVLGPGPLNFSEDQMISELETGKALGIPKGGMTVCFLGDVAKAHLIALEKGKTGECYILGGPNVSHREFYEVFARLLKVKLPRLTLPSFLLKLLGELALRLEKLKLSLGIPSAVLRLSSYEIYHDCEKAKTQLGYTTRSFEEIAKSVVEYRKKSNAVKV